MFSLRTNLWWQGFSMDSGNNKTQAIMCLNHKPRLHRVRLFKKFQRKNLLDSMMYTFPGHRNLPGEVPEINFNGVDYEWVANGVEGMSGIRGISYGVVLTENNSYLVQKGITDADPSGTWVGFADDNGRIKFACYKTTGGTIKCTNNSEI